jgi:hypothetical protein
LGGRRSKLLSKCVNGLIDLALPFALFAVNTTAIPMVTDFGLAKRVAADSGQTRSGAIVGTPSFVWAQIPASSWTRACGLMASTPSPSG